MAKVTNSAWIERQTAGDEARRKYEQERLVLWTTERISELMEQAGVSRAELARLLGTSRPHVTALLSGGRNMTLRTLADVCTVLGYRADVRLEPLRDGEYISKPVRELGECAVAAPGASLPRRRKRTAR